MTAPFGIEFYSAVDRDAILNDLGGGAYLVKAPKSHPNFDTYVVRSTPNIGVFWIKASSQIIEGDAYGHAAVQRKNDISAQLANRYGAGKAVDFLLPGSVWNEPQYWTQGLSLNERKCYVSWERGLLSRLPDDIQSIFLGVCGFGPTQTGIVIEYSSRKMMDAEKEIQISLSDLL